MPKSVSSIPKGSPQASPYLVVRKGAEAIEFYQKAFGAKEVMRIDDPSGRVGFAELAIGTARIMVSDEYPEMNAQGPEFYGGSPVMIHLVDDADEMARRAVQAGAKMVRPVEDQFSGDRTGKLTDPFGHTWFVSTHVEALPNAELKRRAAEMYADSKR